jgi:hypothetical protein
MIEASSTYSRGPLSVDAAATARLPLGKGAHGGPPFVYGFGMPDFFTPDATPAADIRSRVLSIAGMLSLGQYYPAAVQREYQWEPEQCEMLLNDLMRTFESSAAAESARAAFDEAQAAPVETAETIGEAELPPTVVIDAADTPVYYLGSIVVQQPAPGIYHLFDGLQRVTTLTILLAVLRDLVADRGLAAELDRVIVFAEDDRRRTYRHNLRSTQRMLREEVQPRGEAARPRRQRRNLTPSDQLVRDAVATFLKRLRGWTADRRDRFARWLLADVKIGQTEVGTARMGRQIFVSTNLYGVRLNKVDLFKGQLMDLAPDDATAQTVSERWARIQRLLGDDLEGLLIAVDFLARRESQGPECLTQLAAHIEQTTNPDAIGTWVGYLEGMATAWKELHAKMNAPGPRDVDKAIWKLSFLPWSEWKPLALLWYRQYMSRRNEAGRVPPQTWATFQRRFMALHGRCLAMTLAGYSADDRSRIIAKALAQASSGRDPLALALAFDKGAYNKMVRTLTAPLHDPIQRRCIVRWIESSLWIEPPAYIGQATVEHVLPQNPPAGSEWASEFPDDDDRFQYTHALGNLAPLDRDRQAAAGNKPYSEKRTVYEALPRFMMLEALQGEPHWTRETIKRRKKALIRHVFETLDLPIIERRREA